MNWHGPRGECGCCPAILCECNFENEEHTIYFDIDVTIHIEEFWTWEEEWQPHQKYSGYLPFSASVPLTRLCRFAGGGLTPYFRCLDDTFKIYTNNYFGSIETWNGFDYDTTFLTYNAEISEEFTPPAGISSYFSRFFYILPGLAQTSFCIIGEPNVRIGSWIVNGTLPGETIYDRRDLTILTNTCTYGF